MQHSSTLVHPNPQVQPWLSALRLAAQELGPQIIHLRRHLHAYPELSMREFATTNYLAQQVEGLGLQARITQQRVGLCADWDSSHSAPAARRVGIRGDIDALPIASANSGEYASRCTGVMHACGHDAHASMVWGALALLQALDRQGVLPKPVAVRAIFQPAEETSEGGPLMIAEGALQNLAGVLALHVDPTLPVGVVAGRTGPFTAACDSFEVDILGRSGHSARPHLCVDAIAAAASWISEMYGRIPRVHDCRDPAVVSVGTIQAGTAPNIVAGAAFMTGTMRTFSQSARAAIMQEMRNVAAATEKTFGCQVEVRFSAFTPSVHNDARLHEVMFGVAGQIADIQAVQYLELPSMGAEDFAFFGQQLPVCMMRLGIAGAERGMHALHTPQFDIDEQALTIGAQLLAASIIEWCTAQN